MLVEKLKIIAQAAREVYENFIFLFIFTTSLMMAIQGVSRL